MTNFGIGPVAAKGFLGWLSRHPRSRWKQWRSTASSLPDFVESRWKWAAWTHSREHGYTCVARLRDGSRFRLAGDALTGRVILETYGKLRELYLPPIAPHPGDAAPIILDVGGHHGIYTVAAARHYSGWRVITLEPDPVNAAALRENVALNGLTDRVEVVEAGIAGSDGTAKLAHSDEGSWGHQLVSESAGAEGVTVPTVRLETVLRGRTPAIVKSNCEGGEFSLIPQLFESGLKPLALICMVHAELGDAGALRQMIEDQGYNLKEFSGNPSKPRWLCLLKPA